MQLVELPNFQKATGKYEGFLLMRESGAPYGGGDNTPYTVPTVKERDPDGSQPSVSVLGDPQARLVGSLQPDHQVTVGSSPAGQRLAEADQDGPLGASADSFLAYALTRTRRIQ